MNREWFLERKFFSSAMTMDDDAELFDTEQIAILVNDVKRFEGESLKKEKQLLESF